MTQDQKDKIAKVYELVNRGEMGEKEAAKKALDKLLKKYNLSEEILKEIHISKYTFTYSNMMEIQLLEQLHAYFLPDKDLKGYLSNLNRRAMVISLEYMDYVVLETAYEYFRRHMNAQFKKICLPEINKCRKAKTKNKRRSELQKLFIGRYIIVSKIYLPDQVQNVDLSKVSDKERIDRLRMKQVEGGEYNQQVTTGLLLGE